MALRLFYIGSGDAGYPRSGMDMVVREHIRELVEADAIETTGVFVAPGPLRNKERRALPSPFEGMVGFRGGEGEDGRRVTWGKIAHVLKGKLLMNYSFVSAAARRRIREGLAAKPDVIVVDHLQTLANVSVIQLVLSRSKVVFIGHDVTHDTLISNAKLRKSPLSKAFLRFEAIHAWATEMILLKRADRAVFISGHDAEYFRPRIGETISSLCPVIGGDRQLESDATEAPVNRRVVFIGTPSFPPNRHAIEWIVRELAPRLAAIDPTITFSFVGGGTKEFLSDPPANVEPMGFVEDAALRTMLGGCVCMISPVVHGSGIKIKVLEAFAAGCPVVATAESLRGLSFMNVPATLDLAQPGEAAAYIADIANSPEKRIALRAQVREAWARHVADRNDALTELIVKMA